MENSTTGGKVAGTSSATDKAAAEAEGMLQRAAQKAHEAVDKIAEGVQRAHGTVDRVTDGVRGAHSTVDRLAGGVESSARRVSEFSDEYGRTAREYIVANPLTAVAAAFAVGVLFQKLFGR